MTDELVRPISVVDPDDDFPDEPSQLLLGSSNRDLLGPAPKTKPKRKKTPDVDIRDNILLSEEEAIQKNIDPKDDEQIKIEAEKIKKFYVMNCQEVMISIWRLTDPISDFVHRPVIQSYVLELEKLMRGSVETPSAATVIPYILEEDAKRRCLLNLSDDKLRDILEMLLRKELLLKVDSEYSEDLMSLQEYAEALKAEDATFHNIQFPAEILDLEFGLNFDAIAKLSKLLKLKKPPKSSSKKGSKEPSAKRVKGDDGSTKDRTFENRLQYIWITTRGTAGEKTENPWVIAPYRMNMVYDDNELPRLGQVSLVFVDLARNLQFEATKTLFETIMLTAIGMTICSPILFTFVLFPGQDVLTCLDVVKSGLVGWEIDVKWASCEFLNKSQVAKSAWHLQADAVVLYILCKNQDAEGGGGDWTSALNVKAESQVELSFHVDPQKDYDLHTIKSRSKDEEAEEEKSERLRREKELELLSLAPRFTDRESKGALVNDMSKSRRMIAPGESDSYQQDSIAGAGVDLSTQPMILNTTNDPEPTSDADFEDMMNPEQALIRKRGLLKIGSTAESSAAGNQKSLYVCDVPLPIVGAKTTEPAQEQEVQKKTPVQKSRPAPIGKVEGSSGVRPTKKETKGPLPRKDPRLPSTTKAVQPSSQPPTANKPKARSLSVRREKK
ncbi:hypothetical protein R1sor_009118 [Riccia sorocarpa]|uniref:Uncharacterized protein n=1 Tax=Riccia sorocarpa TaxID=122646 RepID=A0ABD3H8S9_9MARC